MKNTAFTLTAALALLLGASACSRVTSKFSFLTQSPKSPAIGVDQATVNPEEEVPLSSEGTVMIRNFSQISQAMAIVTGIPVTDATADRFYKDNRSRFSLKGEATSVSDSMIMAHLSLAGIYCQKLVFKDAGVPATSRLAHQLVNFASDATPANLTQAIKEDVVKKYFQNFLRRDPSAEELSIVAAAMTDAATKGGPVAPAPGLSAANNLRAVLILGCTSVLGSAEFLQL